MTPNDLESELCQPLPRTVRATAQARWSLWALFLAGTICPAIFVPCCVVLERDFDSLKAHGVETHGTVIDRKAGGHKSSPSAVFKYYVGQTEYRFRRTISNAQFEHAAAGHAADITYLADRPQVAELSIELEAHRFSTEALCCGLIGIVVAALTTPAWLYQLSQQHKALRLARFGTPSRTKDLEAVLVYVKTKYGTQQPQYWRVSYEFEALGNSVANKGKIPYQSDADYCVPGAEATVLYDPADPSVNQLYLAIKNRCEFAI